MRNDRKDDSSGSILVWAWKQILEWWERKKRIHVAVPYDKPIPEDVLKLRLLRLEHEISELKVAVMIDNSNENWVAYQQALAKKYELEDKIQNMYGYSRRVGS